MQPLQPSSSLAQGGLSFEAPRVILMPSQESSRFATVFVPLNQIRPEIWPAMVHASLLMGESKSFA